MERIVLMTTQRGGFVFDPFGGAGTTAIAATKLGRNFVVVEQSKKYVRITERKLAAMRKNFRRFGVWEVPRKKTKKKRRPYSQAAIHRSLKQLTRKLGRLPTETDIDAADPTLLKKIDAAFSSRKAALKRCKQALPGA